MSEFFIQENSLDVRTRLQLSKTKKDIPCFLMVGRWGTKGDALSSLCEEWRSRCSRDGYA